MRNNRTFRKPLAVFLFTVIALAAIITPFAVFAEIRPADKEKAETPTPEFIEPVIKIIETEETKAQPKEPELIYWDEIPLDSELQNFIVTECERLNIRPAVVFAMIWRESQYTADAVGDSGDSFGLMQIQVKWHYARMLELDCTNLLDPLQNVTVGINILKEFIDEGNGIEWALMAYNAGATVADEMDAASKISDYAKAVINEAERLDGYILH